MGVLIEILIALILFAGFVWLAQRILHEKKTYDHTSKAELNNKYMNKDINPWIAYGLLIVVVALAAWVIMTY